MVAHEEEGEAQWSLNALVRVAQEAGIAVKRSQIRRILLHEKVRWRNTHSWSKPRDKDASPKRAVAFTHYAAPAEARCAKAVDGQ